MILALYKDPMSSGATKEPKFCKTHFSEAKICLMADEAVDASGSSSSAPSSSSSSSSSPKINANSDGEVVAVTNNLYIKVHRGHVNFLGTGPIEGHPDISGIATVCQYRCFMYGGITFIVTLIVLLLVGVGYLIAYLASL